MGKNKGKPNAFTCFMNEYKKKEEEKGRRFPRGLADVQADPEFMEKWRKLSIEDKQHYKQLAKETTLSKRTSTGELVEDIVNAKRREKEFHENMLRYINDMVRKAKDEKTLPDLRFYVIHVNFFYYTSNASEINYYPAEIAIGEFTLRNEVSRIYHVIFNEKLKTGYYFSANERSNNTHKIEIEGEKGTDDYCKVFDEICQFIGPKEEDGKYPPMFTVNMDEDTYSCAKSVLSRLAIKKGVSEDIFTLYSFEQLFVSIYKTIDNPPIIFPLDDISARDEIRKDPESYKLDIACDYHKKKYTSTYCSEALIKRWYRIMRKFCYRTK